MCRLSVLLFVKEFGVYCYNTHIFIWYILLQMLSNNPIKWVLRRKLFFFYLYPMHPAKGLLFNVYIEVCNVIQNHSQTDNKNVINIIHIVTHCIPTLNNTNPSITQTSQLPCVPQTKQKAQSIVHYSHTSYQPSAVKSVEAQSMDLNLHQTLITCCI